MGFDVGGLNTLTQAIGNVRDMFRPSPQRKVNYTGPLTSPENSLSQALSAIFRLGQGLSERQPVQFTNSLRGGPGPVSVPGVPFQIGGAFGRDPATQPSAPPPNALGTQYDPFQSLPGAGIMAFKQPQGGATGPTQPGVRRRNPDNG